MLKSISHKCHLFEVAFVWEVTKETIHLSLGFLQGGARDQNPSVEMGYKLRKSDVTCTDRVQFVLKSELPMGVQSQNFPMKNPLAIKFT